MPVIMTIGDDGGPEANIFLYRAIVNYAMPLVVYSSRL